MTTPTVIDVTPVALPATATLSPAVTKRAPPLLEVHGPEVHAKRLLLWLQDSIDGPVSIYAEDAIDAHREMCADLLWEYRPWNPVARELRKLLGGKKYYPVVRSPNGDKHRLCVYEIPTRDAVVPLRPATPSGAPKASPTRRAA